MRATERDDDMHGEAQTTRDLLMVRPVHFGPNRQTAASNAFQCVPGPSVTLPESTAPDVADPDAPPAMATAADTAMAAAARAEFDGVVAALRAAGARVIVVADTESPAKPDAVFPNNWMTTHAGGDVFLFPLEAPNRRAERRRDIVEALAAEHGFTVARVVDWSGYEREQAFLEGTGSMVLDRVHRVAYAARSTRTQEGLVRLFAREAGFEPCLFDTRDAAGRPVYHTNVMLAIGCRFAVFCGAMIADAGQREAVRARLGGAGRTVIDITPEQMAAFAGNLLEIQGADDTPIVVLSRTAHAALTPAQREMLGVGAPLLPVAVDTIERIGGGGVRCMLAEIFLPRSTVTGQAPGPGTGHGV